MRHIVSAAAVLSAAALTAAASPGTASGTLSHAEDGAIGASARSMADADIIEWDARRDAHQALDITRVSVFHSASTVRVVVRMRDFARMDSQAPVATAVGVHFDTDAESKPDHLVKVDGMHTAAGSTTGWNKLRPNGVDPWGDWNECVPDDWDQGFITTRPRRNEVVFNAPVACLGDPPSVRVAVQSYRPYGSRAATDWAPGVRRYLARVILD